MVDALSLSKFSIFFSNGKLIFHIKLLLPYFSLLPSLSIWNLSVADCLAGSHTYVLYSTFI